MEDDDRLVGWSGSRGDAAHLLGRESLDRYSLDELDQRVALLEAEIARVAAHRRKSVAHRLAADALFGNNTDSGADKSPIVNSSPTPESAASGTGK